jgi:hypothetical protein
MRRSLKRRILVTVGALVCPALALVGYLATEVSRREFNRLVLIEPPNTAWREQQARQLAETVSAALQRQDTDAGTPDRMEALLARSAGKFGPGVVALVTGVDGSFIAGYPSQSVRVNGRAPDG